MKVNCMALLERCSKTPPSNQETWSGIEYLAGYFWQEGSIENKIAVGLTSKTIGKFYCRPYSITAKDRLKILGNVWNIVGDPKTVSVNEMEIIIQRQVQG